MYLLGYDIGSSSVKASLVDAQSGICVASAFYPKTEAPILAVKQGWRAECAFACFSFHSPSTPFYHICSVVFNSMTRFYRRPAQLTTELEAKPPLNPLKTPFFTSLGGGADVTPPLLLIYN